MTNVGKLFLTATLGLATLMAGQGPNLRLRELVDRTQNDLRSAAELEHGREDQRRRFSDAQGHLSTFDRKMTRGKFNRSELNKSIDSIHSILNKNVLQPSTRDMLTRDITELKIARDRRDY